MDEDNAKPTPEESYPDATKVPEDELIFEIVRYEYGVHDNEYGDAEVVDRVYQETAKIIAPGFDQVIQAQPEDVACWSHEHQGHNYIVIEREGGYIALRTDVVVGSLLPCPLELRSVALEGAEPSRAWEFYTQSPQGTWEPVEGQHLRARTAPAQQWLEEMENIVLPLG